MSTLHASDLDAASRSDLIARAEALGIDKADVLTRAELVDEIVKRTVADPIERRLARGLLGVARDLVARVVERGLHLPDAAALIRGLQQVTLTPVTPPIATVTLADIYAGQGHRARALAVLDEVLANEPDHAAARVLRDRIAGLPADMARTVAPSAPTPDVIASTPPDLAHQREHDHDSVRERDTLPPEADLSSTVAPSELSLSLSQLAADVGAERAPDAALPPVETAPVLETLDADQIVLMPVDGTSALARWELRRTTLDEARLRAQGGELIVRIVAVTPSWDAPQVEIRDVEVSQPVGDWWVCDLPSGAVLRGAIGWRGDRGFDPLAVALDVAANGEGALASEASPAPSFDDARDRRARIEDRARRRAGEGRPVEGRALSSWRTLAPAPWEATYEEMPAPSLETR
jgi:hypothetical protein